MKLVFDLHKQIEDKMVQVVHVSYSAKSPVEAQAIQAMADDGIKPVQAEAITTNVFTAAKKVVGKKKVPKKDVDAITQAMSSAVSLSV